MADGITSLLNTRVTRKKIKAPEAMEGDPTPSSARVTAPLRIVRVYHEYEIISTVDAVRRTSLRDLFSFSQNFSRPVITGGKSAGTACDGDIRLRDR